MEKPILRIRSRKTKHNRPTGSRKNGEKRSLRAVSWIQKRVLGPYSEFNGFNKNPTLVRLEPDLELPSTVCVAQDS